MADGIEGFFAIFELVLNPIGCAILGVMIFIGVMLMPVVEIVDCGSQVVVKEDVFDDDLTVWRCEDPGESEWFGQWFGDVESYYAKGKAKAEAVVEFDGKFHRVTGVMHYRIPTDDNAILALHDTYGSQEAFERRYLATQFKRAALRAVASTDIPPSSEGIVDKLKKSAKRRLVGALSKSRATDWLYAHHQEGKLEENIEDLMLPTLDGVTMNDLSVSIVLDR